MKVLILAGGYGTRLARDLASCQAEYPHLVGVAKPLLPVAGSPLITHWVRMLRSCDEVKSVYVIANKKYYDQFEAWSKDFSEVELLNDGTNCNDERLGATASIQRCVKHFNVHDDLMVIGGDTLFFEDFSLSNVMSEFMSGAKKENGALVSCYRCKDEETSKHGIVEVNEDGRIVSFLEKPLPSTTKSRLACPCFYIFSEESLKLLDDFLDEKKDSPIEEKDATGHFLKYLSERRAVYTSEVMGRFDVGGLQTYLECCRLYKPVVTK